MHTWKSISEAHKHIELCRIRAALYVVFLGSETSVIIMAMQSIESVTDSLEISATQHK